VEKLLFCYLPVVFHFFSLRHSYENNLRVAFLKRHISKYFRIVGLLVGGVHFNNLEAQSFPRIC